MNLKRKCCEICGKTNLQFTNQRAFLKHFQTHKTVKISCKKCEKVFDNEVRAKAHEKYAHTAEIFKCGQCYIHYFFPKMK